MKTINFTKVKDIITTCTAICGAIAGLWGVFKPEKKAEAAYAAMSKKVDQLEKEITILYQVSAEQKEQIIYLLNESISYEQDKFLQSLKIVDSNKMQSVQSPAVSDINHPPKPKSSPLDPPKREPLPNYDNL